MKKFLFYFLMVVFWAGTITTGHAKGIIYLKDFSILKISPSVDNIIFTFNNITKYRFIMLSHNYWYIAAPGDIIAINTPLKAYYSVKKILVRIIKGETRIFFRMNRNYNYRFHIIISKNHHYLVVRIEKIGAIGKKPFFKKTPSNKRKFTIVIDPGHGGKDPGAIGIYNEEKNVVLAIGKYVAYYLRKDGYRVVMTRTKDTYPTLAQRVELANKVNASVFVSIHANYAPKDRDSVRGLEVYFLNTTSDKRALWLAAKENGMSISQISDLNRIILSLIQTSKIQYSKILASDVYKEVLRYGKTVYHSYIGRGVKQAPFYVLVGTHCPSILVETAFINNPMDALYLKSNIFRKAVAKGISKGIEIFLKKHYQVRAFGYDPKIFKKTVSSSTSERASLSSLSSICPSTST